MDEEKRGGITDRLPSLPTNWRFARNMSIRCKTVTQASSPSRGESLVSPDRFDRRSTKQRSHAVPDRVPAWMNQGQVQGGIFEPDTREECTASD